jgi:hypothetical protein
LIDADDGSGRADQVGRQHYNVAGAAAEIQDTHARSNAALRIRRCVNRADDRRLLHQEPELAKPLPAEGVAVDHYNVRLQHGGPMSHHARHQVSPEIIA